MPIKHTLNKRRRNYGKLLQFQALEKRDLMASDFGQMQLPVHHGNGESTEDVVEVVPGDIDADGDVDFADFLSFSRAYGRETDQGPAGGDFDLDGVVDFTDFLLLSVNFGRETNGNGGSDADNIDPELIVPAFNSLVPSERNADTTTIHLDFDGHEEEIRVGGGGPLGGLLGDNFIQTKAEPYSRDSDTTTFSDSDRNGMEEIWALVAEDFAPFNVNVTTVEPRRFSEKAMRVVIGGSWRDWYGREAGGVAYTGINHLVFVFSESRSTGAPASVAITVSHEVGHAFGLDHQEWYDAEGGQPADLLAFDPEFNPGQRHGPGSKIEAEWAPIMGDGDGRTTWHKGPTSSPNRIQDDMEILSKRLGYRPDDHGDNIYYATWLQPDASTESVTVSGMIARNDDVDYFAFWHGGGGVVSIHVSGATVFDDLLNRPISVSNLDADLELRDANGKFIDPVVSDELGPGHWYVGLTVGLYHAVVKSHGEYGDVGKYDLEIYNISDAGLRTLGPKIIAYQFSQTNSREALVTFDRPIDLTSFTFDDLSLEGVLGNPIPGVQIAPSYLVAPGKHANRTLRLFVYCPRGPQCVLRIGPHIRDVYGSLMNQDSDSINGESKGDRFALAWKPNNGGGFPNPGGEFPNPGGGFPIP